MVTTSWMSASKLQIQTWECCDLQLTHITLVTHMLWNPDFKPAMPVSFQKWKSHQEHSGAWYLGLSSEEYRQSEPQFLKSTRFLAAWEALGVSGESSCILSPSIAALQVSPWSIPRCHHHPLLLKSGLSSSNLSRRWQKVRPFKRLF